MKTLKALCLALAPLGLLGCTGYAVQPGLTESTNGCSLMVTQGAVKAAGGLAGNAEVCKLSVTGDCFKGEQDIDLDALQKLCEQLD